MAIIGISVREFSRREGVSHTLVFHALKTGKLARLPDGQLDPALVGTPWRLGVRRGAAAANDGKEPAAHDGKDPGPESFQAGAAPGSGLTYIEALRLKENFLAALRRLEYQRKSGALVEMDVARDVLFELCREQRNLWLAWPARVAPLIAAQFGIADLDGLTEALAEHVHQQLAELSDPDGRFEAADG